jgi:hypothetical protein
MFEHLSGRNYAFWNSLTPALRTGKPQSGTRATGNYRRCTPFLILTLN